MSKKNLETRKDRVAVKKIYDVETDKFDGYMYEGQYIGDTKINTHEGQVKFGEDVRYVKSFTEALFTLAAEGDLTKNQGKIVMSIPKFLRYNTGMIAHDNGIAFGVDDFAEKLNMPHRSVYEAIEALISKGVISKVKTLDVIEYYANPYVFTKGQYINDTLYNMFRDSKWANDHETLCDKYIKEST